MLDVQNVKDLPPIETTVTPSEITKGYDFEVEKREARIFLDKLKFKWKGQEEGGFATVETFRRKLGDYLRGNGRELKIEPEYIEEQMNKAIALANNCFDKLGLKEAIEDNDVCLPYHGKDHARNTLFNGMGAWLVKVRKLSREYGLKEDQQKKWIAIGARVLALHEIDDWWEPTSLATDDEKASVRKMIIDDLAVEGIDPEDFDDFIRLDNFMEPVTKMLGVVQRERKGFLVRELVGTKKEEDREVNKHPALAEALGDTVVGADFMQTLNDSYQEEIPVIVDGKQINIMAGPLALVFEMFLEMPQRISPKWQKLAGYLRTIDFTKVGLDMDFLEKITEKTAKHWDDLGEFNQKEGENAGARFRALVGWVALNEMKQQSVES